MCALCRFIATARTYAVEVQQGKKMYAAVMVVVVGRIVQGYRLATKQTYRDIYTVPGNSDDVRPDIFRLDFMSFKTLEEKEER